MSWYFACWYRFSTSRSYFDNYWVGIVKNGWGLRDHGALKSGISHKWFDKLSRSIEWFFYADSDGVIFGFTINLLCINLLYSTFINAGGPLQYYLARVFKKNSLSAKMSPKYGFFLLKNVVFDFCWKRI